MLLRGRKVKGIEMVRYNILEKLNTRSCFIAICFIGLFLRVFYISHQSIWIDEIASVISAKQATLTEVIKTSFITERIPPLYPMFLHFWIRVFGPLEFSIRIPSAIFGFLTIPIIFILSKSLFDNKVAVLSSLFLAISPFHIWYSQEARCFTMMLFLNLLSIMYFLKILHANNKFSYMHFLVYLVTTCMAMLTNYLMIFTIIAQNVIIYFRRQDIKKTVRPWLYLQLLIILLSIIPSFFIFTKQVLTGYEDFYKTAADNRYTVSIQPDKKGFKIEDSAFQKIISKCRDLRQLVKERFNIKLTRSLKFMFFNVPQSFGTGLKHVNRPPYSWDKLFSYAFILPSTLFFLIVFACGIFVPRGEDFFHILILFIFPIFGVFLIVLLDLRPIYTRHVIQSLPLFYIFIAIGLFSIKSIKIKSIIVFTVLLLMSSSLSIYYFDKKTYKDDWRYVSTHVLSNLTSKDFIIFHGEYPRSSFLYYTLLNSNNRKIWETGKPANMLIRGRDGSFNEFLQNIYKKLVAEKSRIWVITYYAIEKERDLLKKHIEKNFKLVHSDSNLGKKLYLELYESL